MRRNTLLVAIFILTFCGCATTGKQWTKENCTQAEFEIDRAQCEYEVKLATPPSGGNRHYRSYGEAIGAGIGAGIADGMRMADLFASCMRARGYRLIDVSVYGTPVQSSPNTEVPPEVHPPTSKIPSTVNISEDPEVNTDWINDKIPK